MKRIPGILFGLMVAISGMLLSSCTTWDSVVLPSGQHGYTVDCSGTNLSWSHCYEKAGRVCPQGYDIAEKSDNHGGKPVVGDLYGVLSGSVVDRSMLIECKEPGAAYAVHAASVRGGAIPHGTSISAGDETIPVGHAETFPVRSGEAPVSSALPASTGGM